MSDAEFIDQADDYISQECLLQAAQALQKVEDDSLLTEQHHQVIRVAQDLNESTSDLRQDPDASWTKQSETLNDSSQRDTTIYFKVTEPADLQIRIDCVVETSLLVPFLSVLNETSLYATWIPSWTTPVKLGVQESTQLEAISKGSQIVWIQCAVPWPMSTRDVVLRATACDDIEQHQAILVRMKSLQGPEDHPIVPACPASTVRVDFEGAILIRPCPPECVPNNNHPDESHVLVSFKMFVDPKLSVLPISLINFVTKTVIGTMWNQLMRVAEGVRDGSRPLHKEAIARHPELYRWIEDRIQVLLKQMEEDDQKGKETVANTKQEQHSKELNDRASVNHDFIAYIQS